MRRLLCTFGIAIAALAAVSLAGGADAAKKQA